MAFVQVNRIQLRFPRLEEPGLEVQIVWYLALGILVE